MAHGQVVILVRRLAERIAPASLRFAHALLLGSGTLGRLLSWWSRSRWRVGIEDDALTLSVESESAFAPVAHDRRALHRTPRLAPSIWRTAFEGPAALINFDPCLPSHALPQASPAM
jgi:hypothetical protein